MLGGIWAWMYAEGFDTIRNGIAKPLSRRPRPTRRSTTPKIRESVSFRFSGLNIRAAAGDPEGRDNRDDPVIAAENGLAEDVHGCGQDPPPAQVGGPRLRVPGADVALLVLEVPRVYDYEGPLPDPHALFQFSPDPA